MNQNYSSMDSPLLHPDDLAGIEQFEKNFFKAFVDLPGNFLLKEVWNWDFEQQRIRLKQDYTDLTIFQWLSEDKQDYFYVAGADVPAMNSQLSFYGFTPPTEGKKCSEVMTLFLSPGFPYSMQELETQFIREICFRKEKERGIERLFATTAKRFLPLYLNWGWVLVEERDVRGQMRYFIRMDI